MVGWSRAKTAAMVVIGAVLVAAALVVLARLRAPGETAKATPMPPSATATASAAAWAAAPHVQLEPLAASNVTLEANVGGAAFCVTLADGRA
jgi:hypothetical protein